MRREFRARMRVWSPGFNAASAENAERRTSSISANSAVSALKTDRAQAFCLPHTGRLGLHDKQLVFVYQQKQLSGQFRIESGNLPVLRDRGALVTVCDKQIAEKELDVLIVRIDLGRLSNLGDRHVELLPSGVAVPETNSDLCVVGSKRACLLEEPNRFLELFEVKQRVTNVEKYDCVVRL